MNEAELNKVLSRGVEHIYPNKDDVAKRLLTPQTIYWGIDPTAPTLHLGHITILLKMAELQKLGHNIIILLGDFTAMIGDPDKLDVRKPLTRKEVLSNLKLYKKQIGKFIALTGKNKARIVLNSTWLSKMRFEDVLNLASKMTVDQMLKRDMFVRRASEDRPIYIHEFMYPLMQGYDSVHLGADGEIGGNDQTFNMLAGRTLSREFTGKDKFVISLKLLTDPTGKKMGKSEGNMLSLLDTPEDMFGKVMSWPDGMIISGFEICTRIPIEDIDRISHGLEKGMNPKEAKLHLAEAVVETLLGKDEAVAARKTFEKTFSAKEIPDDIKEISVEKGSFLVDILLEHNFVSSKSEWRRLIEEKAVRNMEDGVVVDDPFLKVHNPITLKIGKRRFLKINIK